MSLGVSVRQPENGFGARVNAKNKIVDIFSRIYNAGSLTISVATGAQNW
jgi:hypothetical protein